MADPRGWVSRIKEVAPPDLWSEVVERTSAPAPDRTLGPAIGGWPGRPGTPRRAALLTGVAAGILALALVIVGLRSEPVGRGRVTPTPEVTPLPEVHRVLEGMLNELWTAKARLFELQGAIVAAQEELAALMEKPNPSDAALLRMEELQAQFRAWTESAAESRAVISMLEPRIEQVRAQRAELVPPPDAGEYPDVATVTCDGDGDGGTHLSTPVIRSQPDGMHIRVVNRLSNERVFLTVQPDGVRSIPAGETVNVVLPPRPSHDVEITCTYEYPRGSWERPTHPLWIEDDVPGCAEDDDRRNAAPVDDAGQISVYFSCEADADVLGTEGQPVYMFPRSVPEELSGTTDGRLEAALRAYFGGPTPHEAQLGYFTPAPASLGAAIREVSLSDGNATVDFEAITGEELGDLGTSTASLAFLIELRAVAFQFPDVQELVLQVDGDCETFWHMLEMSCQVLRRTDACPTVSLVVSRLPWLPHGTAVPDPGYVEDRDGAVLVWFEDEDLRWAGSYVAVKRSTEPLVGGDLSEFPTVRVRGEVGHLVWIGDPGVGEVAIIWSEDVEPCSWFSLSMSSLGMSEAEAERTIIELSYYLMERTA